MTPTLTVGSLFAGIGGFDLGLEAAGMRVRWQVEIDPFCRSVLARHWPDVRQYGDIRTINWNEVEPVDVVCGGFPCQPVSVAGKQRGVDDERWLWPEFERCIRDIRPRYVLVENVPALVTANGGRAFGEVLGDLAALGYNAEWTVYGARDVGAPHRRDRLWLVAYADGKRSERPRGSVQQSKRVGPLIVDEGTPRNAPDTDSQRPQTSGLPGRQARQLVADACGGGGCSVHAYTNGERRQERHLPTVAAGARQSTGRAHSPWSAGPPVSPVCGMANGRSDRLDVTLWRNRIRALGNAIVPQCAEFVGRRVIELATRPPRNAATDRPSAAR